MDITEFLLRGRDYRFLTSGIHNAIWNAWDHLSTSDFAKLYRLIRPYTMVSNARLRALHGAVEHVVANGIKGDMVECGSARGGSAALIGLTMKRTPDNRLLWVFDNFEGMPEPSANDPDVDLARRYVGKCKGELEEVTSLFMEIGILANCKLVKGLFQDTLPNAEFERISLLHIDSDWYDSVTTCLENCYDRVSSGGVIQIDDYGYWQGARSAVDDFFRHRNICAPLSYIDYSGRQFIKP